MYITSGERIVAFANELKVLSEKYDVYVGNIDKPGFPYPWDAELIHVSWLDSHNFYLTVQREEKPIG